MRCREWRDYVSCEDGRLSVAPSLSLSFGGLAVSPAVTPPVALSTESATDRPAFVWQPGLLEDSSALNALANRMATRTHSASRPLGCQHTSWYLRHQPSDQKTTEPGGRANVSCHVAAEQGAAGDGVGVFRFFIKSLVCRSLRSPRLSLVVGLLSHRPASVFYPVAHSAVVVVVVWVAVVALKVEVHYDLCALCRLQLARQQPNKLTGGNAGLRLWLFHKVSGVVAPGQ